MARTPDQHHSPDISEEDLAFIERRSAENWARSNSSLARALNAKGSAMSSELGKLYPSRTLSAFNRALKVGVSLGVIKRLYPKGAYTRYRLTRLGKDILEALCEEIELDRG